MKIFITALLLIATATAQEPGQWPIKRLQTEVPAYRVVDDSLPIHSLIYEGEKIDGAATEVFAFYASPKTLGNAKGGEIFPGMVLIHGGGGTAFSDWVLLWAQRGYAAIAMDLSGRRPPAPQFNADGSKVYDVGHGKALRTKLAKGGVDHGHPEKFGSIGGTIEDDWPFHAVASVMRAHSILRQMPGVDSERTAVTGISWGGYTTCLVASHDNRFKAAVPVYGCGFLHEGESVQKPSIDALGDRRAQWVAAYDPGSHLGKCEIPTFWVNGTHDKHYVLDSYAKSYSLVKGPRTMRIEPRMAHSHGAGWAPEEIGIYIDSILKDGTPLPTIGAMSVDGNTATVPFESEMPVVKAELHYTTESGLRTERNWKVITAKIEDGKATAHGLPPDANTWLVTFTDSRGALVSTEVGLR